jgi:hypothetical protein
MPRSAAKAARRGNPALPLPAARTAAQIPHSRTAALPPPSSPVPYAHGQLGPLQSVSVQLHKTSIKLTFPLILVVPASQNEIIVGDLIRT